MWKTLRSWGITKTTIVGYLQLFFGVVQLVSTSPVVTNQKVLGALAALSGAGVIIFRIVGMQDDPE